MRKLSSLCLSIALFFQVMSPLALASTDANRISELRQESTFLLRKIKKMDSESKEYEQAKADYQRISRELRILLRNQQGRETHQAVAERSERLTGKDDNTSINSSNSNASYSSVSRKRLHPIELKRLREQLTALNYSRYTPAKNAPNSSNSLVTKPVQLEARSNHVEEDRVVEVLTGKASYYADFFDGRTTASGTTFSNQELTAAHKTLPFGTEVLVTHLDSGNTIQVTITDRGPYVEGRIIDLSQKSFAALAPLSRGVLNVTVHVLE